MIDNDFDAWRFTLEQRLAKGRREYGDRSFTRAPHELAQEVMLEQIDQPGWLFVLWARVAKWRPEYIAAEIDLQRNGWDEKKVQAELHRRMQHTFLRRVEGIVKGTSEREDLNSNEAVAMYEIETLVAALFQRWLHMRDDLQRIGAIVSQCSPPIDYQARGRRGSRKDPRSSD